MADIHFEVGSTVALSKPGLDSLINTLHQSGYETVGPQIRDNTVVYDTIVGLDDLPRGYISRQDAGTYRLIFTGHENYFDITPGADSWKKYFFPPRSHTCTFQRDSNHANRWHVIESKPTNPIYALIGVRSCELSAILIQDQVFLRDDFKDPLYRARRQGAFILAVNCLHPGGTCFCTSMGTGPKAESGFDLCLTELEDIFLVQIGSEAGRLMMSNQEVQPASAFWQISAQRGLLEARQNMGRSLHAPQELPEILLRNLEHPQFDQVARRCLSCTNCTQVCPTCFCWTMEEINELAGQIVRRERIWDSCFNPEYSHVFGGNSRPTTLSRYRQWITHKLAGWYQQFGVSGCVGCGRCITWCPAGIDITVEAATLQKETIS